MRDLDLATAAVNELFETWAPSLYRYSYRICRSAELADDFVQEAFLALYRELCAGRKIEAPKAWTLSVVRHGLANWRRSHRRHPEDLVPPDEMDLLPVPIPDPTEGVNTVDDFGTLLAALTPREEEVVLLRMQSLKYREIAAQLGISDKSVATLLARALKKMRVAAEAESKERGDGFDVEPHVRTSL